MDLDAKARFALISENLAEVLNPELIENILAEGRNPRVYWGNTSLPFDLGRTCADLFFYLPHRYRDDGPTSLWLLCPGFENRPAIGGGLRRDHLAGRHSRIP